MKPFDVIPLVHYFYVKTKMLSRFSDLHYCPFNLKFFTSLYDFRDKGEILIWREYYNGFGIYQCSRVSLLDPQQNNLSNLQAYSEPCQTSKMECFAEIVNG